MRYRVLRIDEDLDFGCEERSEETPVMAVVTLEDENGSQMMVKQPDDRLYERNINEGDSVYFDDKRELLKLEV